ncbi:pyridoxal phosphate-dependent transferase [Hygrophoropsis aurantiaca]|uniref:Pyridoxal phosphate-dependent transferase n=1 Tax=Hygrophoropsis aurantiaca TaxID=72124 RepID=A0ACB8A9A1_9AGAM|nr:pyridoxal phosphate-dependent transferase [Hygrophoropsis aurantiaca]
MDIEQFRKAGYQAIDRICDYYYSLQNKPVASQVEPGYLRKALPESAPENGEDFQIIADDYQKFIVPGLTHWQHPSFFAYFPTACTFEGILGELYATSASNPGFNWSASPACTELEAVVTDWAAKLLGLDPAFYNSTETGGGVIQTTASDSVLIATVAARARYLSKHPSARIEELVIYTTTQTHSLGKKAGLVLGLAVRALEVEGFGENGEGFGLTGERLSRAIEEDLDMGRRPFVLIATVGSTSSGAVDYLADIGQTLAAYPSESIWLHVDAAWAGVSMACPEYREPCQLSAVNNYADSYCTNFHKWGLINFDSSFMWVRHRQNLINALDITPEFLRTKHGDAGTVIDYRNWHLGLGRRFRSLKAWFVFRSYGVQGFQKYIRDTVHLNEFFAKLITDSAQFTLVVPPFLALTVFRLVPPSIAPKNSNGNKDTPNGVDNEKINALNRKFYARLSARTDIALTQTDLNGTFCIRLAVGAARTSEEDIKRAYDILCEEADLVLR